MAEHIVKVSVNDLGPDQLERFKYCLKGVLSTQLAERTFAQIVDGLPTRDDVGYFPTYSFEIKNNSNPSHEAIADAVEFRDKLDSYDHRIDSKVAQAYQDAIPESREFYMRLLEVLALACHDIAVALYEHTKPGRKRERQSAETILASLAGRPTDFMHEDYVAWEQYPNGVADMVGYWAEYHLFGGVVLFDRSASGLDCKNAFLHPVGGFRIFQLSECQLERFAVYARDLANSIEESSSPFPFKAEKYTYRVDPYDAMSLNIYRNKYERKIPSKRPARCVQRLADFPDLVDGLARINSSNHG